MSESKPKYFLHAFVRGSNYAADMGDIVSASPVDRWEIRPNGILTYAAYFRPDSQRVSSAWWGFDPGNRYYIIANYGHCQEPNGDIIWRWENGAQGDEKAAA